jgi:LmbE family N-acetylglucosaminyl deacetylase
MVKKENILFICAHNDDQIIGGGGTFAKYAEEGKNVKTVVFSYGEKSHPHLKPAIIVKKRIQEAKDSDKVLGGKGITFFGLEETKFPKEIKKKGIKEKLLQIIKKDNPAKIFTHSASDAHPDHRAIYNLIMDLIEENKIKSEVYSFEVWTLLKFRKTDLPQLVVDVTGTFNKKLEAYDLHESQVNLPLMIPMRFRMILQAKFNGWHHGHKYTEVFTKLN